MTDTPSRIICRHTELLPVLDTILLTMFAAVAEFERAIMLERQRAGVARARAEGKYRGRVPTARHKGKQVVALHATGKGASAIAAEIGISGASVYRVLAEARG